MSVPPRSGSTVSRRTKPNQSSSATAPSAIGTMNAAHPRNANSAERHHCRTAPWSVASATAESTANATTAMAPISSRMRESMAPVAPLRVAHVPDTQTVHVDDARLDLLSDPRPLVVDLEDVAVGDHERVFRLHAQVHGDSSVSNEHPVFAVDRQEMFRAKDVEEKLQLFLARVSRNMRPRRGIVNDLRAELEEVVDRAGDELLVPRNRRRRHDDGITFLDGDMTVVPEPHSRKLARRLPLVAGRADAALLV